MPISRRRIVICLAALLLLAVAVPAGAQPAPRAPDMSVDASSINDSISAGFLHGYIQVEVTSFSDATSNASDPTSTCHPSATAQPDETVWFKFAVGDGALDLSTAGSTFATSGGGTHIMTIYRYVGNDPVEVGCDAGGAGDPAVLGGFALAAGRYVAVIGVPDGDTVTSGSLLVTMDYDSDYAPSNDDFANAKPLKLPANPTTVNLESATYETGEIVSTCATVDRPSNSVWYKVTFDQTTVLNVIVLFAEGSGWNSLTAQRTIFTLFEETGFGLDELGCDTNTPNPGIFTLLGPGTYYLRLEGDLLGGLHDLGLAQMMVLPSINKGAPTFSSADVVAPDISGWKVKNDDGSDGINCGPSSCKYILHSSGPTEATRLVTTANLNGLKLKKNDLLTIAVHYTSTSPSAKVQVIVTYTDGKPKTKFGGDIFDVGTGAQFFASRPIASPKIKSIKVKLTNTDTTPGDELAVELVILGVLRLGEMTPRGVLPLPQPAQ